MSGGGKPEPEAFWGPWLLRVGTRDGNPTGVGGGSAVFSPWDWTEREPRSSPEGHLWAVFPAFALGGERGGGRAPQPPSVLMCVGLCFHACVRLDASGRLEAFSLLFSFLGFLFVLSLEPISLASDL